MRFPWVNSLLLFLLLLQLISGLAGFLNGREMESWLLWVHGIGAYAICLLMFWKGSIILSAYTRKRRLTGQRLAFAGLLTLLLVTLLSGFIWTYFGPHYFWEFSLITWHIFLALGLAALLTWHIWHFRWIVRVPEATNRRAFLRLGVLSAAGLFIWQGTGVFRQVLPLPGGRRRFTGSYETGSLSGIFPQVSWIADPVPEVDISKWRLVVDGLIEQPLTLTWPEILEMEMTEEIVTLDCTGGWYSNQMWRGIPVSRLLATVNTAPEARSVSFVSLTGYERRFTLDQARRYLLATHVAGQPLSPGHGYPLRLVAPNQRGVHWVKWLTRIQINRLGNYWQLPLPAQ